MDKVLDIIEDCEIEYKNINLKPFSKEIKVFGWQKEYDHILQEGVCKYLFCKKRIC